MPKFVFPLHAVLRQREHEERRAQQSVAVIERERLDLEARVAACQAEIRGYKDDLRSLLAPATARAASDLVPDMRFVRLQTSASLHAESRTRRLALQLAGVYQRAERARAELRHATTRRKAVEALRDRMYEQWKRELSRRESNELDEIATIRAARERIA